MLTELTHTHPCGAIVQLVVGAWTTPRSDRPGRGVRRCPAVFAPFGVVSGSVVTGYF